MSAPNIDSRPPAGSLRAPLAGRQQFMPSGGAADTFAQAAGDHHRASPPPSRHAPTQRTTHRSGRRGACCCRGLMWRLINCFRTTSQQEQQLIRPRPLSVHSPAGASAASNHYQAPVVTPSPRASGGSGASSDDPDLAERGTLLPKRRTPEPSRSSAAATAATSSAAAAAAVAAAVAAAPPPPGSLAAAAEAGDAPPRHRRTGSGGPHLGSHQQHVEGVRGRVLGGSTAAAAAAAATAKAKFGTTEAEFAAVTELLGVDVDDDDFCPTCLEAYSEDNPKIFTRCGHSFHMQCIYAWLERKATCPLCESAMDLQGDVLL